MVSANMMECKSCGDGVESTQDLAIIQVVKINGFSVSVVLMLLCKRCGIGVRDDIDRIKRRDL